MIKRELRLGDFDLRCSEQLARTQQVADVDQLCVAIEKVGDFRRTFAHLLLVLPCELSRQDLARRPRFGRRTGALSASIDKKRGRGQGHSPRRTDCHRLTYRATALKLKMPIVMDLNCFASPKGQSRLRRSP